MADEPFLIDNLETPANALRVDMALPLMYGGRNIGARQGIRPGGNPFNLSIAGTALTVQPGVMVFDPAWTSAQGPYWWGMSTAWAGVLQAADASTRRDVIVAEILDDNPDANPADAAKLAQVRYIPGTSVEPALAQNQERLWSIEVPPVGAAIATDRRRYTVAAGGILPVSSEAEMDALPAPYFSQVVSRMDLGGALFLYGALGDAENPEWGRISIGAKTLKTDGLTEVGNWTVTWSGTLDYPFVDLTVEATRTSPAIVAGSTGNISDENVVRLPAGFRPRADKEYNSSNGVGDGSLRIEPSGQCALRTWSGGATLAIGTTLRFSAFYRVP